MIEGLGSGSTTGKQKERISTIFKAMITIPMWMITIFLAHLGFCDQVVGIEAKSLNTLSAICSASGGTTSVEILHEHGNSSPMTYKVNCVNGASFDLDKELMLTVRPLRGGSFLWH